VLPGPAIRSQADGHGVRDVAARARIVQGTFDQGDNQVLDVVESGDKVAVAFRMGGQQVGPLPTALGLFPATNERLDVRVIDILTLTPRGPPSWVTGRSRFLLTSVAPAPTLRE
jgi:hypothetical protein